MNNKLNQHIGICGGGQLGKMLLEAAAPLSLHVSVLDADPSFPAGPHTSSFVKGDFTKYEDVMLFGKDKDIITIEIESVNLEALIDLEKLGKKVYPQARTLAIIKDKGIQKQFYQDHSLPTSTFGLYDNANALIQAIDKGEIKVPFVQKSRTDGYDGRGVHMVRNNSDLDQLLDTACLAEELVDIHTEIAVIVARNPSGEVVAFPAAEQQFHPTANLVEFLFSPSHLPTPILDQAKHLAITCAEQLDIVGLLAVEMFYTKEGHLLINEVAPRPHNSGHHFTEGCYTSQFAQMWRAILDLPLGDTTLVQASVMVNMLGAAGHTGSPIYNGIEQLLKVGGVYPHIYGKTLTKPFRKMGHITCVAPTIHEAIDKAQLIKDIIKVIA